jgi:hypothetical protein
MYTPHIETDLELMQIHIDKGDKVYRFICNGELSTCDLNQKHEFLRCLKCRDIREVGGKTLSKIVETHPMVVAQNIELPEELLNCKTPEDLKKIYFKNFDVGYAIASTMISMLRNPDFDVLGNLNLIKEYYKSTVALYLSTIDYINKFKPDRAYLYNGRYSHVRAILRACESEGVLFLAHERGCNQNHYDLFYNKLPHDKKYAVEKVEEYWLGNKHELDEKIKIGSEFYISRKRGNPKDWTSYTNGQDAATLPDNFNKSKINIGIFNSSMDEFASISQEWSYSFFEDQEEFIQKLSERFKDEKEYHFYLRVHPNLKDLKNSQTESILKLKNINLTVIPGDSKVGSYQLLDHCDKVITFGSTMGIEAVFWNKPSILVSSSFYSDESTYVANSYEEVDQFIRAKLPAKDNIGAIKYGYYHSVKGIKFKYFVAKDLFKGTFKNFDLMRATTLSGKIIKKAMGNKIFGKLFTRYAEKYQQQKLKLPI